MQTVYRRATKSDEALIGVIANQSKSIFIGSPLIRLSFNDDTSNSCPKIISRPATSVVDYIALSHDERSIAFSTSTVVKLLDVETGRDMRTLVGHNGRINDIVQSNRSIYIWASVSSDSTLMLWDTRLHPANVQTRRLDRNANCVRFSPNDAFLALGSDHVYMIDQRNRDVQSMQSTSQILQICFHPSEYLLATGSEDRLVRFWDIDSQECVSQSEPAESPLKSITFQEDGLVLFTLTDRRCAAICWEPCEICGQCSFKEFDRSISMRSTDSDMLALGYCEASNEVALVSLPIPVLLRKDTESDESSVDQAASLEDSNDGSNDTMWTNESCADESKKPNEYPFIPSNDLPRTPPPPPSVHLQLDTQHSPSMSNAAQLPSRPKVLKNRKTDNFKTLSASNTVARSSVAGSHSSQFTLNQKNFNGSLPHTFSAPDIRTQSLKKRVNKTEKKSCERNQKVTERRPSFSNHFDELKGVHEKLEVSLLSRQRCLESALQCWRTRGFEASITEARRAGDPSVLAELIDSVNHSPSNWNLTLCASVLPHLEFLLSSEVDSVEVALASLRIIINGCGEIIRSGSVSKSHIGVDVTADERHIRCMRCMQYLTNIRVKSSLMTCKMNGRHIREFNALMQVLDESFM